jgi:hypothetical protein
MLRAFILNQLRFCRCPAHNFREVVGVARLTSRKYTFEAPKPELARYSNSPRGSMLHNSPQLATRNSQLATRSSQLVALTPLKALP